jgi:hypothetical protein
MLYSFCTETIGQMRRACSSCFTETFEMPTWRILPARCSLGERADRIGERHLVVRRVELVQVDALELQSLQASVERAAQMLGARIRDPLRRARAQQPAFRRDHEILRDRDAGLPRSIARRHAGHSCPRYRRSCNQFRTRASVTRSAFARSLGGPHTCGPHTRIAPNPRRLTRRSPTEMELLICCLLEASLSPLPNAFP